MGDRVWYIASVTKAPDDVAYQLGIVRKSLVDPEILQDGNTPKAMLGNLQGPVLRPGAKTLAAADPGFEQLLTNGAEFCESPILNWRSFDTNRLQSKSCGCTLNYGKDREALENAAFDAQLEQIVVAANESNFTKNAVTCLVCNKGTYVNDWVDGSGFILGGFGIGLWNWNVLPELTNPVKAALTQQLPETVFIEDGLKI